MQESEIEVHVTVFGMLFTKARRQGTEPCDLVRCEPGVTRMRPFVGGEGVRVEEVEGQRAVPSRGRGADFEMVISHPGHSFGTSGGKV